VKPGLDEQQACRESEEDPERNLHGPVGDALGEYRPALGPTTPGTVESSRVPIAARPVSLLWATP
jgi:hypothetical protein